jgi:hypothetical protein
MFRLTRFWRHGHVEVRFIAELAALRRVAWATVVAMMALTAASRWTQRVAN